MVGRSACEMNIEPRLLNCLIKGVNCKGRRGFGQTIFDLFHFTETAEPSANKTEAGF